MAESAATMYYLAFLLKFCGQRVSVESKDKCARCISRIGGCCRATRPIAMQQQRLLLIVIMRMDDRQHPFSAPTRFHVDPTYRTGSVASGTIG
eukprot:scaffold2874_cov30-Attheya_sp.AAC.1